MVASFPCLMLCGIELPVQTSCKTTLKPFLTTHFSKLCVWSLPTTWITPDHLGHPKLLLLSFSGPLSGLQWQWLTLSIFGPIPNLIFDCSKLLSLTTCGGSAWRSRTFHIFHPYVGGSADTSVQYIHTWNDCDYNIHVQGFIQKKFGGSIWKLCSMKHLVTFWRVWLTALWMRLKSARSLLSY